MRVGDKFLILWPPSVSSFASMTTFNSYHERRHVYPFMVEVLIITRTGNILLKSEYGYIKMKKTAPQDDSSFDPITI